MDKRILYGGGAALAAYFWWASRSTSTAASPTTRTTSTTPNGVGFDLNAALSRWNEVVSYNKTTAPDAKAANPVATPAPTPPAPATTSGFSLGPSGGKPTASPAGSGYYGALGIEINDPVAVDRFDSINTYINTLDWSADNKASSAAALAGAANQFGVSQAEIAIASGYNRADIETLLAGQDVPRF